MQPKLRFKGFDGSWNLLSIGDIARKVGSGCTPRGGSAVYQNTGIPFLRSQNINHSQLIIKDLAYIDITTHEKMKNSHVQMDDILLNITGASIGRSCVVPNTIKKANVNQHVCIIRLKEQYNSTFIQNFLSSAKGQAQISMLQAGGGREGLSFASAKKINLYVPIEQEQIKIANFLSTVDRKIDLLTQQQQVWIKYKQGMMQKLFSGKVRFKDENGREFPDWEHNLLKNIAFVTTGSSNRQDSDEINGKYVFFDRSQDIRTSQQFLFDAEAVIVGGEGQEFLPKYYIGKFDLHQRAYAIMQFNPKVIKGKYIYYYLYYHQQYFLSVAVGSTVKSLRLPMFQNMEINTPCLEEQNKIINYFSNLDKKINTLTVQLEQLKKWKQGLLQQMFI